MERTYPRSPRIITGNGEDLEAAMVWLRAVMHHIPRVKEHYLRRAPASVVLMAYRKAVLESPEC